VKIRKRSNLVHRKTHGKLENPLKSPLIVALDVDDDHRALQLADELHDLVGAFKLGPRLVQRYGSSLSLALAQRAPLFIDCKFFDIPSTMEAAIRASFAVGATLATVHALAGREALATVARVEKELNQERPFKVLAVTILTSWDQNSLPKNFQPLSIADHVKDLGQMAVGEGLTGLVCSPEELSIFSEQGLFLVTPGIRFDSATNKDDQKRTVGPREALRRGASALVVGRPIVQAPNPRVAAMDCSVAMWGVKS